MKKKSAQTDWKYRDGGGGALHCKSSLRAHELASMGYKPAAAAKEKSRDEPRGSALCKRPSRGKKFNGARVREREESFWFLVT